MKVLFVSRDYRQKKDGGSIVVYRNLSILKQLSDSVDEFVIPIPSTWTRIKNILFRENYGNTSVLRKQMKQFLKQKYDLVFFDSSLYGEYLRIFSQRGFKTCCFYHNIEFKYYEAKYKISRKIQDFVMVYYVKYLERLSTDFATYRFVLNERDKLQLLQIYSKKADFLFPTSFDPINLSNLDTCKCLEEPPYVLFIGSNFFANVEGLDFLIKKVAKYIKYRVMVVGNVCDVFRNCQLPSNIILKGMVEDLLPYYSNALCVVAPIFSGSGLKTKTIEALRYGKYIIGTKESFEGIPSQYISKIGKLCMTDVDFIDAINTLEIKTFNVESLHLFLNFYSNQAQKERLSAFLEKVGIMPRKD